MLEKVLTARPVPNLPFDREQERTLMETSQIFPLIGLDLGLGLL
jgi:hypothetical protein